MRDLGEQEVETLAEATGLAVAEVELERLTIRVNGFLALLQQLETLPLKDAEIVPTLLTQGDEPHE